MIPGKAGSDYPILPSILPTSFDCDSVDHSGYYADTDEQSRCQMFHVCLKKNSFRSTQKWSFLCPNGTVFSQANFVCVLWNDAPECGDETISLYSVNEMLGWDNETETNAISSFNNNAVNIGPSDGDDNAKFKSAMSSLLGASGDSKERTPLPYRVPVKVKENGRERTQLQEVTQGVKDELQSMLADLEQDMDIEQPSEDGNNESTSVENLVESRTEQLSEERQTKSGSTLAKSESEAYEQKSVPGSPLMAQEMIDSIATVESEEDMVEDMEDVVATDSPVEDKNEPEESVAPRLPNLAHLPPKPSIEEDNGSSSSSDEVVKDQIAEEKTPTVPTRMYLPPQVEVAATTVPTEEDKLNFVAKIATQATIDPIVNVETPEDPDVAVNTESPVVAETVVQTEAPKAKENEVDTEAPEVVANTETQEAAETVVNTETPEAAETVVNTETPKPAETVVNTETPEAVDTADTTETPKTADIIENTETPDAAEKVAGTEVPEVATEIPEAIEKVSNTEIPQVEGRAADPGAPDETATVSNTETPEVMAKIENPAVPDRAYLPPRSNDNIELTTPTAEVAASNVENDSEVISFSPLISASGMSSGMTTSTEKLTLKTAASAPEDQVKEDATAEIAQDAKAEETTTMPTEDSPDTKIQPIDSEGVEKVTTPAPNAESTTTAIPTTTLSAIQRGAYLPPVKISRVKTPEAQISEIDPASSSNQVDLEDKEAHYPTPDSSIAPAEGENYGTQSQLYNGEVRSHLLSKKINKPYAGTVQSQTRVQSILQQILAGNAIATDGQGNPLDFSAFQQLIAEAPEAEIKTVKSPDELPGRGERIGAQISAVAAATRNTVASKSPAISEPQPTKQSIPLVTNSNQLTYSIKVDHSDQHFPRFEIKTPTTEMETHSLSTPQGYITLRTHETINEFPATFNYNVNQNNNNDNNFINNNERNLQQAIHTAEATQQPSQSNFIPQPKYRHQIYQSVALNSPNNNNNRNIRGRGPVYSPATSEYHSVIRPSIEPTVASSIVNNNNNIRGSSSNSVNVGSRNFNSNNDDRSRNRHFGSARQPLNREESFGGSVGFQLQQSYEHRMNLLTNPTSAGTHESGNLLQSGNHLSPSSIRIVPAIFVHHHTSVESQSRAKRLQELARTSAASSGNPNNRVYNRAEPNSSFNEGFRTSESIRRNNNQHQVRSSTPVIRNHNGMPRFSARFSRRIPNSNVSGSSSSNVRNGS